MEIKHYTRDRIPDVLRFERDLRTEESIWSSWTGSVSSKAIAIEVQALMQTLRKELKEQGVDTLIGLIASNEDAQRFYHSLPCTTIKDEGIWIDL